MVAFQGDQGLGSLEKQSMLRLGRQGVVGWRRAISRVKENGGRQLCDARERSRGLIWDVKNLRRGCAYGNTDGRGSTAGQVEKVAGAPHLATKGLRTQADQQLSFMNKKRDSGEARWLTRTCLCTLKNTAGPCSAMSLEACIGKR